MIRNLSSSQNRSFELSNPVLKLCTTRCTHHERRVGTGGSSFPATTYGMGSIGERRVGMWASFTLVFFFNCSTIYQSRFSTSIFFTIILQLFHLCRHFLSWLLTGWNSVNCFPGGPLQSCSKRSTMQKSVFFFYNMLLCDR